ncbi:MAG: AAA family ATPase, partial [Pikeienuella sp.]
GAFDDAFGAGAWIVAPFNAAAQTIQAAAAAVGDYFVIGVQQDTEADVQAAAELINTAREAGLKVVLLAEALSPVSMHALMRAGADDFAPLPLPGSALADCIRGMNDSPVVRSGGGRARKGLLYPVYGAAGGVGASTFAVNLAWETALLTVKSDQKVAVLDFNFQYGSVATYLDLARREAIYELLSDTSTMDEEGFSQALTTYGGRLGVLTAPMDALPLDIITPDDVMSMLALARANFDYIFIDMPQTLAHWSDLLLQESEMFFALMESDMRSAQNMLRFIRAVKAEELPLEKVAICLNRAPSFSDLSGKSRATKLEKSLGATFAHKLPDGGKQVAAACDQGSPLAQAAKGNALRKEVRKVAQSVVSAAEAMAKARAV